jgi:hypothetical protein
MTCQRIKRVHRLPAPIPIAALLGHNPVDSADQLPESGETRDDTGHDAMSEQVALTVARRVSSFPTEQYQAESNKFTVRLSISGFTERGEDADPASDLGLRLRLPGQGDRAALSVGRASVKYRHHRFAIRQDRRDLYRAQRRRRLGRCAPCIR